MKKTTIKILGERNTGTNFLTQLVALNFEVNLLFGSFPRKLNHWPLQYESIRNLYFKFTYRSNLGWKHAIAPNEYDINNAHCSDIFFLTITKNPYSWLLSMYKRPYHYNNNFISFEEFLQSAWPVISRERYSGCFLNPIEIWNKKNASYLNLNLYANALLLRYEDILDDPEIIAHKISERLGLVWHSSTFTNIENASKKQDSGVFFDDYRSYYLEERWKEQLTDNQISLINESLDFSTVKKFSYIKL